MMFDPANWSEPLADLYYEALDHVPAELIELAVKRCIKSRKFMPRPAEMLEEIAGELTERTDRFNDSLRQRLERIEPPKREPLTDEQHAALDVKMAEFRQEWGPRPKPRAMLPPHSAEKRPLRPIGDVLAGFRLPAADDPRVVAIMAEMIETGDVMPEAAE